MVGFPKFYPTSFLLSVLPDAILKWVATFVNKKLQEKRFSVFSLRFLGKSPLSQR